MRPLRILYVGNFEPRHSTENHVRASLEVLGHHVIPVQENQVNPIVIWNISQEQGPVDLVLYTRTWGLHGPSTLKLWERFLYEGIPTASYHLDLYYGLARDDLYNRLGPLEITSPANDPFWQTTFCCTVDGDPEAGKWFESQGINHHWVRAGVYHAECYIAEQPEHWKYPVTFVGSVGYHPEWPWRPRLVSWLKSRYGQDFHRFGPPNKTIRNEKLNAVYAQSAVVVGDTLNPGFIKPKYSSDRIYETLGRGGFLVYPYIEGQFEPDGLVPGEHFAAYEHGSFSDLAEVIDYYLENPEEREKIRLAGHHHVKNNCTYLHRMQEMLETIFG